MNLDALVRHRFEPKTSRYTARDTILYALSVGAGTEAAAADELGLVYEENLQPLPTMAAVLAHPGLWIAAPEFAVTVSRLLHGEQRLDVERPLPPEGEIVAEYGVHSVVDKGEGKGALVYFEKRIADAATGQHLCTATQALFLRADGGCGNYGVAPPPLVEDALDKPEFTAELHTASYAALLYRLNGDRNPIHVDPAAARAAGFERPILHGLCTYGVVGYLLTRSVCNYQPQRIQSLAARFISPVFPGETIRVEGRRDGAQLHFRASVPARKQVVLSHGIARIAE